MHRVFPLCWFLLCGASGGSSGLKGRVSVLDAVAVWLSHPWSASLKIQVLPAETDTPSTNALCPAPPLASRETGALPPEVTLIVPPAMVMATIQG